MDINELSAPFEDKRATKACVVALAAWMAAGCAADAHGQTAGGQPAVATQEVEAAAEEEAPAEADEASEAPAPEPSRDGVFFSEVTANGTGCPEGSWHTAISSDGLVFTMTFSQYEASVTPDESVAVSDCLLAIRLHSPGGLSYSVQSFSYSGYAVLDEGVTAEQSVSYWFQGSQVHRDGASTTLVGPYDDPFLHRDDVRISDRVLWSPCGLERDLNVVTRLQVHNSEGGGTGYANVGAIDGSAKLEFKLAWRTCEASE